MGPMSRFEQLWQLAAQLASLATLEDAVAQVPQESVASLPAAGPASRTALLRPRSRSRSLSPRPLPIVLAAPSCSVSVVPRRCPSRAVLRLHLATLLHRCSGSSASAAGLVEPGSAAGAAGAAGAARASTPSVPRAAAADPSVSGARLASRAPALLSDLSELDGLTVALSCRFVSKTGLTQNPTLSLRIPDVTFGSECGPGRAFSRQHGWTCLPFVARGSLESSPQTQRSRLTCCLGGSRCETLTPAHVRWRPSDSATCDFLAHAERLLSFVMTRFVRFRAHRHLRKKKKDRRGGSRANGERFLLITR